MSSAFTIFRTIVFYLFLALWTISYPTLMLLVVGFIPFKKRHRVLVHVWSQVAVWLCRLICGVRWQVHGGESIPQQPCVIISNHQSTWETFFLQTLISPQVQVLKKELLSIPFFGWALHTTRPIAINRKDPRDAMQRVRKQGAASLALGVSVLIFPEGTRNPGGQLGKFSRGGAGLACSGGVPVLPIAHNAGDYWPNNRWIKKPGTIDVYIGDLIATENRGPAEVTCQARDWIEAVLEKTAGKDAAKNTDKNTDKNLEKNPEKSL